MVSLWNAADAWILLTPNPWKHNPYIPICSFQVAEATPHVGSQWLLTRAAVVGTSATALKY